QFTCLRREDSKPVWKPAAERPEPLPDPGFTRVDLLPTAHEANHDTPVGVPVHHAQEELGLGHVEVGLLTLRPHELRGLNAIPRALRFVEHGYSFYRRPCPEVVVAEVVDILDERFRLLERVVLLLSWVA